VLVPAPLDNLTYFLRSLQRAIEIKVTLPCQKPTMGKHSKTANSFKSFRLVKCLRCSSHVSSGE